MFLDSTYFQGELYIPNACYNTSAGIAGMLQAAGEKNLHWYIAKYEREYLIRLLGIGMYHKMEGIGDEENEWSRLRDMIFTKRDGFPCSPAANYVYFHAMRDMQTQTSPKGEVRGKQEHASTVSAYDKLVRIWNDMVDESNIIIGFLIANREVYGKPATKGFDYINKFGI